MNLNQTLHKAKVATNILAQLPHQQRQEFLRDCALGLEENIQNILQANTEDLKNAQDLNLSNAMMERLSLDEKKIKNMAQSLRKIADFQDPLHKILSGFSNSKGLDIQKVSTPLGVIAIIYESRPNVTSDTAGLCFKSGNVCILKGGKEAQNSNEKIIEIFHKVLNQHHLPLESITLLPSMQNREDLKELLYAK
ncbi:MAG: aldehyde dehydrogenase family protein, partial [Helicobacter sp.]|nr:aldehyde dehydrogenase family protein [Helicobacter sp.]